MYTESLGYGKPPILFTMFAGSQGILAKLAVTMTQKSDCPTTLKRGKVRSRFPTPPIGEGWKGLRIVLRALKRSIAFLYWSSGTHRTLS